MKTLNLNNMVVVELTEHGKSVLRKRAVGLNRVMESDGLSYKCQLWELMRIFGADCYNGAEVCFKNNEIKFMQ